MFKHVTLYIKPWSALTKIVFFLAFYFTLITSIGQNTNVLAQRASSVCYVAIILEMRKKQMMFEVTAFKPDATKDVYNVWTKQ